MDTKDKGFDLLTDLCFNKNFIESYIKSKLEYHINLYTEDFLDNFSSYKMNWDITTLVVGSRDSFLNVLKDIKVEHGYSTLEFKENDMQIGHWRIDVSKKSTIKGLDLNIIILGRYSNNTIQISSGVKNSDN